MKVNGAPKNLYLSSTGKLKDGISTGRFCDNDIEYIRTDAFIEKAVKWLEDNAINYWGTDAVDNGKMMLDFKKAMRV